MSSHGRVPSGRSFAADLVGGATRLVVGTLAGKAVLGTVAGAGVVATLAAGAWAGLQAQARLATERIGMAQDPPPVRDGSYLPSGRYRPTPVGRHGFHALRLVMLGDSTSAGYGAADEDGLPGVMMARALAAELRRPVQLHTVAVVGSGAADLKRQTEQALRLHPDLAIVVVGPNDVRERVSEKTSVAQLKEAVRTLRAHGAAVVVGTCPDLGVIAPIPQPLRQLAGYWSRTLADQQERAVREVGAVAVPVGRQLSAEFLTNPELFAVDRFHPSAAGYARAVAALLPAARRALGLADRGADGAASGATPDQHDNDHATDAPPRTALRAPVVPGPAPRSIQPQRKRIS